MRKLLPTLCILASSILFSCSSNEDMVDVSLIGTQEISEINNDPGDGSGVYTKVESSKVLIFQSNNEVTSNGSLCDNTINSDSPSSGVYIMNQDTVSSGIIQSLGCNNNFSEPTLAIRFEIKRSILYIYYPCFEGCAAKYVKKQQSNQEGS